MEKKYELQKSPVDYLILGTSHANSFDFYRNKNALKFNKSGNTLYYDYQNYSFLNSKGLLNEEAVVIIPISYFSFGLNENRNDNFELDYYSYLPPDQIYDYSWKKSIFLFFRNFQKSIDNTLKPETNETQENKKNSKNLERIGKLRAMHHKRITDSVYFNKNVEYLSNLIQEVNENHQIPVLVSTPFYQSYLNQFDSKWLHKNFYDNVSKAIHLQGSDIIYLDYSHDKRFIENANYFKDSDHLNANGKKVFDSIFLNDLTLKLKNIKINTN